MAMVLEDGRSLQRLGIPDGGDLPAFTDGQTRSAMLALVKTNGNAGASDGAILGEGSPSTSPSNGNFFVLTQKSGSRNVTAWARVDNDDIETAEVDLSDGAWHLVYVERDGDTISIRVDDGVRVSATNVDASGAFSYSAQVQLGVNFFPINTTPARTTCNASAAYFTQFSGVLTDAELDAIYAEGDFAGLYARLIERHRTVGDVHLLLPLNDDAAEISLAENHIVPAVGDPTFTLNSTEFGAADPVRVPESVIRATSPLVYWTCQEDIANGNANEPGRRADGTTFSGTTNAIRTTQNDASRFRRIGGGILGPYAWYIRNLTQFVHVPFADKDILPAGSRDWSILTYVRVVDQDIGGTPQFVAGEFSEEHVGTSPTPGWNGHRRYASFLNIASGDNPAARRQLAAHSGFRGGDTPRTPGDLDPDPVTGLYPFSYEAAVGKTELEEDMSWRTLISVRRGNQFFAYIDGLLDGPITRDDAIDPNSSELGPGLGNPHPTSDPTTFDGANNRPDFYVGANAGNSSGTIGNLFEGVIGGIAVWDRALTESEIASLHFDPVEIRASTTGRAALRARDRSRGRKR